MNDQQTQQQSSGARDKNIRAALERTRGRHNIQLQRSTQPSEKRFSIRRIIGASDLWVTEFILTYDGKPSYTVSIMEFSGDKVTRETQYFADPFPAPAWRAQLVERMDT
jgi:hypothetical protein